MCTALKIYFSSHVSRKHPRHCEEPTGPPRSGRPDGKLRDEAIQYGTSDLDCFADARNDERNRSRGAFAPELCDHHARSKTQPLARRKSEGSGAPKDAIQPMSAAQTSARKWRRLSAFGAEARRRIRCLRNASASGRARLPAHRCGSRQGFDLLTQLQAMLPGMFAQRALPAGSQAQCRDSTSRRGRSTAGRDARSRPAPGLNRS